MSYTKFLNRVSYLLLALFVLILGLFFGHVIQKDELVAIITAKLIMTLHFLAGMHFNRKGLGRTQEIFMIYVFGGMTARLFSAAALIIFCFSVLKLNFNYLIFSVFIFYIIFLILEIWYLTKNEVKIIKNNP
jgi:hypothetical protein